MIYNNRLFVSKCVCAFFKKKKESSDFHIDLQAFYYFITAFHFPSGCLQNIEFDVCSCPFARLVIFSFLQSFPLLLPAFRIVNLPEFPESGLSHITLSPNSRFFSMSLAAVLAMSQSCFVKYLAGEFFRKCRSNP